MPVPDHPTPVAMPDPTGPRGMTAPHSRALPLAGLTILLVEDSRFASDGVRLLCQRSGARLRRAETMAQARAHLRTYQPDMVLVDIGLPDGRGDRLIRDLVLAGRGMVVLGLSGDPGARAEALAAGAAGFVEKPIAGLGAFQRALLRHLPGRFAPTVMVDDPAGAAADLLALQDDLAHAADLMALGPDAAARGYLARFVAGVARSAGDDALAEAAGAAALADEALPRLSQLVKARLADGVFL